MQRYHLFFLFDRYPLVEVQYLGAEQVVVLGLELVALCLHQVLFGFVELHGVGFAILELLCHQAERLLAGQGGRMATGIFAFGGGGVVPGLLDFLVERLLGVVQLEGVVLLLEAGGGSRPGTC